MKFQIAVADADDDKLEALARAIFEDRADYLLADALPGQGDLLPDQSASYDTPEAIHGFVQDVRAILVSQRDQDGALFVELADSEAYGEGSEFEPAQMLKVLREMPGARFVFVIGEEYARGERFPPHAEVRTEEGVFHARVDGDDTGGWEPVLTRGARADAVEAARKVGEVLSADGWLAALTPAAPRP